MRRIATSLVALALVAGACSSKKDNASSTTTRATHATQPPTTAPADVAPLTGLPADAATRGRPVLVVKIDNAPKARPQFGIGVADIVVEEGVEGGITRFATIFQSRDADVVGPVRSARSSDLHIATPLNRPLFAYSGTNSNFQALIDRSTLVNLSPNKLPSAYHRDGSRPAPYNLFSSTQLFYKAPQATSGGQPHPLLAIDSRATATGDPVKQLSVHWADKVRTDVTWSWDGTKWSRVENGTPQSDGSGAAVAPRNIVVLFVNYEDTGERDQSNSVVPEAKLTGSGAAWIVRDGTLIRGTWTKPSDDAPIALADGKGARVSLLPGQSWIELPKPGDATVG